MTKTIKVGDIIFKEVANMNHGVRPVVVIGLFGDWAHLIPLSTKDVGGQPYIAGNTACGYAAPNRHHKVKAADLPAPRGWVTTEDAATLWDSAFAGS